MSKEHTRYINIVWAKCISTFDEKVLRVGEKYRLGIRFHPLFSEEVYYILDLKDGFGMPIYVTKESEYFKEEELSSISFIMS